MSQIRKLSLAPFLWLGFFLLLAGCGDVNDQSDFNSSSGTHPSDWLPAGHMNAALANIDTCADCHGSDYLGGIAKISCTKCHIGSAELRHPVNWGNLAYALHGDYVKLNGNTACANFHCHGLNLDGLGGAGPSCTKCHLGGINSFHPVAWGNNNIRLHKDYVESNGDSSCRNTACHGANLQGVNLSGPACSLCHN